MNQHGNDSANEAVIIYGQPSASAARVTPVHYLCLPSNHTQAYDISNIIGGYNIHGSTQF